MESPAQIVAVPDMDKLIPALSVILIVSVSVQPFEAVAVTVYVPAEEIDIEAVVAPVLQAYEFAPVAVRLILVIEQLNSVVPELLVIPAVGAELSKVVVATAVAVHPLLPVTVTVNELAVETVIAVVDAPVLQE